MLDRTAQEGNGGTALQRADGEGRVVAKRRDERTVLDVMYQKGCGKIRTPRTHGNWFEAVLINTSGGLTGGDRMLWQAQAAAGTHLVVTTQACERIYRAAGGSAQVRTQLRAEQGARLDWLPQETILFEASALDRSLEVDLADDATFLGVEAVILGREAHGETAHAAAITDRWHVRQGGRLVHAEATRLDANDDAARANTALLDGARAFGTLCYVAADTDRKLEEIKTLIADHRMAGVSRIGDKLVLRALGMSGYHLRTIFVPAIAALSGVGAVPRLWSL